MSANGTAVAEPPEAVEAPAPAEPVFPVDSYAAAAPFLRRPFTPEAVKFKPQRVIGDDGKGVECVAYIDMRLVTERLNLVCPHLWHDAYRPAGDKLMWCDLTVDGITRPDVGEGTGKALVSDAIKRAAVKFGVGVSLYAIPKQVIWKQDGGGKQVSLWKSGTKPNGKDKFDARIEPAGEKRLRDQYATWLAEHGSKVFGAPLDHGDVEGHQGDPDEAQPEPEQGQDGAIDEAIADALVSAGQAKLLVDAAFKVGAQGKLQLAASHVAGEDVGDCSTKAKAVTALRKLTVEQADKVGVWVGRKAAERTEAES